MIHLIVGNTGSGKTTYAKELKQKSGGVIFSIDKWNNTLFLPDKTESDGLNWFLERIERAETIMMDLILQLEFADIDTILDLGFSKRSHREKFRTFAKANGLMCKLHFLDISREERLLRVKRRNAEKGDTYEFEVTTENFEFMESWFEKPMDSEMQEGILITD